MGRRGARLVPQLSSGASPHPPLLQDALNALANSTFAQGTLASSPSSLPAPRHRHNVTSPATKGHDFTPHLSSDHTAPTAPPHKPAQRTRNRSTRTTRAQPPAAHTNRRPPRAAPPQRSSPTCPPLNPKPPLAAPLHPRPPNGTQPPLWPAPVPARTTSLSPPPATPPAPSHVQDAIARIHHAQEAILQRRQQSRRRHARGTQAPGRPTSPAAR